MILTAELIPLRLEATVPRFTGLLARLARIGRVPLGAVLVPYLRDDPGRARDAVIGQRRHRRGHVQRRHVRDAEDLGQVRIGEPLLHTQTARHRREVLGADVLGELREDRVRRARRRLAQGARRATTATAAGRPTPNSHLARRGIRR